jgi:hypothetical protein
MAIALKAPVFSKNLTACFNSIPHKMKFTDYLVRTATVGTIAAAVATTANAQLTVNYQFNGQGDWSISGVGSNSTPVGNLEAIVPVGSTIQAAFLYSSQYSTPTTPDVTVGGTEYSGAAWTYLGQNNGYEEAWRTDVTAQMQSAIGGGSASPFLFSVTENADNGGTDGEVLAIVFSNPADPTRTIAFLDGVDPSSGATTTVNYSSPLSGVGSPGFSEEMSIGDGYSYQTPFDLTQASTITVDGRTLTQSAGGYDDGQGENGALITVGGIGDSTDNPDPTLGPSNSSTASLGDRTDDELYDLGQGNDVNSAPFVSNGDTSTTINTFNSSRDDLIFFLGINVTAEGAVNMPPPPPTPDAASTTGLLGLGLVSLLALRRKLGLA